MSRWEGKTYEKSGETTEWDDILIKKGIRTRDEVLLGKGLNPDDFKEKPPEIEIEAPTRDELLAHATLSEIEELEDNISDDRMLEVYRQQRIDEMKKERLANRFGDYTEIKKADWMQEVTDCSKSCAVVVHLYSDSVVQCDLMHEVLSPIARKFPYVKFLKIKSVQAIENWPDRNLPTIFVYTEGELLHQAMTLGEFGGNEMTADDLEWWLAEKEIVRSELEERPRKSPKKALKTTSANIRKTVLDSDEDDDDY